MKYVKMLGLLAVAAASLMAFAGTASAELTGMVENKIHAKSSGSTSLTGTIAITCQQSTVGGEITTNDANEVSGSINTLTFEECGNHTVTVLNKGTLHLTDEDGTTGTLYSTGAQVTVLLHSAILGTVHCIYHTNNTHIGTFTESTHDPGTGVHKTATLHITSVPLIRTTTDSACGSHSTWEGTYEVTDPDHLILH